MAITVRLPRQLEIALAKAARRDGISKSEFVRRCLEARLVENQGHGSSAYELGKDLFGKYGSGNKNLSRDAEQIVKDIIRAKFERSRRRTES